MGEGEGPTSDGEDGMTWVGTEGHEHLGDGARLGDAGFGGGDHGGRALVGWWRMEDDHGRRARPRGVKMTKTTRQEERAGKLRDRASTSDPRWRRWPRVL